MKVNQQTYWIDARVRVDLQRVDVVPGVLEQAIVWVEHLMGQKVEPLASNASVVQSFFSLKLNHEPLSKILWSHFHDLSVRFFKHFSSWNVQATVATLRLEALKLSSQHLHLSY